MTTPPAADRPRPVARGPAELLAVVPYRLGFHPGQSLVLVGLDTTGPGRPRLGALVRADLPDRAEDSAALVDAVVGLLLRGGREGPGEAARLVVLCYDETGSTGRRLTPGRAARAALAHLRTVLSELDLPVADVVLVAGGRWRSLTCRDRTCCPVHGTALSDPADVPVVADAVLDGLTALPTRADALPETTPVAPELVPVAARARAAADREPRTPASRRAGLSAFAAARARYEDPRVVVPLGPAASGRLLSALDDVAVRDAVLLDGCPGAAAERAVDTLLTGGTAVDPGVLVAAAVQQEPDRARTSAGARLAVDVARHAPGAAGAGAWAVAAWAHWSGGDPVRAGACAEAALTADPDQRLAGLVLQALRAGVRLRRSPADGAGVAAEGFAADGEVLPGSPWRGDQRGV